MEQVPTRCFVSLRHPGIGKKSDAPPQCRKDTEHLPDRAHASSLEDQFPGQLAGSSDRIHLSGEKAFAQSPPRSDRGSATGWFLSWLTSNSRYIIDSPNKEKTIREQTI